MRAFAFLAVGCSLLGVCGCGDTKLPTSLDEAKQAVTKTVEHVKETAPTVLDPGSIELNVGQPLRSPVCLATLSTFSSGRPAVLQLKGYRGSAGDAFPAIHVMAQLPEGAASLVAGQTIDAQIHAQADANAPIWASVADSPAKVTISAVEGSKVTGSISQGALVNSTDGSRIEVTGTFIGMMPSP